MTQIACIQGMTKGQSHMIGAEPLLMGRNETNDILILDNKASRTHCKVELCGADILLTDMKSSNGVLVNDLVVEGSISVKSNDIITIGYTKYLIKGDMTVTRSLPNATSLNLTNSTTRKAVIPGQL